MAESELMSFTNGLSASSSYGAYEQSFFGGSTLYSHITDVSQLESPEKKLYKRQPGTGKLTRVLRSSASAVLDAKSGSGGLSPRRKSQTISSAPESSALLGTGQPTPPLPTLDQWFPDRTLHLPPACSRPASGAVLPEA